ELLLHGKRIDSVFQLLGDHENDITYSVGWALAHSSIFLQTFLDAVAMPGLDSANAVLRLQEYASGEGITDIEIEAPGNFHLIVEAKRGWALPTREQLGMYAAHATFTERHSPVRHLITMSECSPEYARLHMPVDELDGVPVVHVSWREVSRL